MKTERYYFESCSGNIIYCSWNDPLTKVSCGQQYSYEHSPSRRYWAWVNFVLPNFGWDGNKRSEFGLILIPKKLERFITIFSGAYSIRDFRKALE